MEGVKRPRGRLVSRWWRIALGPALAGLVIALGPGDDPNIAAMAAVALWMAAWWVTEAVPIPVTALLPLVLLPGLGISPIREVAPNFARSTVFLFLGGFLLALGLQACGVHRRMALAIVHAVGGQPRRIVLGFMIASAFLSMWISNTATVMVLMPIGMSVIAAIKDRGVSGKPLATLGVTVMLGIAYAADMGGMSTLVGTPPNLSYKEQLTRLFPDAPPPSFAEWMMVGLPISIVFLVVGWFILTRFVFRMGDESLVGSRDAVRKLRAELGPIRRDEKIVVTVFALTAILWMTRKDIQIGALSVPGWSSLEFREQLVFAKGHLDDAVVAVFMAILLFIIPSRSRPGERLLEWEMAREVPWGMLLLFGGGFALAAGFKSSGLSRWMGEQLGAARGMDPWFVMILVCVVLTFLTELTSNTATTEMVLPILAAAGVGLGVDPRGLMIPATLSASCAFMMPVASPTQAIVFASGLVPIKDMIRAGIWFNLVGVILVVAVFSLLAGPVMGIDLQVLPAWAH